MSLTGGIVAGIGAASSIAGGAIASSGAQNAASTQAQASDQAAQLQYQAQQQALKQQQLQYGNTLQLLGPSYQTGQAAQANLANLLGLPVNGNVVNPATLPTGAANTQGTPNYGGGNYASYGDTGDYPQQMYRGGYYGGGNTYARTNYRMPPAQWTAQAAPGGTTSLASLVNQALGATGSLMQPWTEQFQAPTGLTEQNDPGYQARLNLGETALQNSAAARGGLLTGGTAAGLNQYAQDYASNEYGNVYNRAFNEYATRYNTFQQNQANAYNRLASVAGIGQTTANQLAMAGQNTASNIGSTLQYGAGQIGNSLQNAGAARASGYVGSANAYSGALGNLGNLASLATLLNSSSNPYSSSNLNQYPIPTGPTDING